jgi:hypothetical protein
MSARKLDEATVKLLATLSSAEILARDPGAFVLGVGIYQRPKTVEGERTRRERVLDHIHAQAEGTPYPKKPLNISRRAPGGRLITYSLDSLKRRRKRTPSERERRYLLGLQLADFLTAVGL